MFEGFSASVILAMISSCLGPLLCAGIVWYSKRYWTGRTQCHNEHSALHAGVQALLRDRILQGCRHYQQKGHSTYNARVNITKMHEAYVGLGGNSIEIHEYDKFMALSHKPNENHY